MYLAGNADGGAGTTAHFEAWPKGDGLTGTFEIIGPDGSVDGRSVDQSWSAGKDNGYYSTDLTDPAAGTYCIQGSGDDGSDQGRPCETLAEN